MSPFNLPEFDPSLNNESRLHVIIRLPERISEQFTTLIKEQFAGLELRYDKEIGLLLLIADAECNAGRFLPELAEVIREYSQNQFGSEIEIVETMMAVPELKDCRHRDNFSRFISINANDSDGSFKNFRLQMVGSTVFGSGTHPSTKLAVVALEHLFTTGYFPVRVLDIGCGSGILSFASCLFGASEVSGIDVSAEAVSVAERNRVLNSLKSRVVFSEQQLSDVAGPFDLVIANVSAAVMSGMQDDFPRLAGKGGKLVLSGLQGRQQKEMAEKMQAFGFRVSGVYGQNQWRAMLLTSVDVGP